MAGFIRCGFCGGNVCGHTRHYESGKDVKYYRCGNHWSQFAGKERCDNRNIDTVHYKIDNAVWKWIKNLLCDPAALEAGLKEMMEQRLIDIEPKRSRLETLDSLIEETEAKIRRLIKEMSNHHDDIVLKAFRQEVGQASKCRDALIEECEKLTIELSEIEITEGKKELVLAMTKEIARSLDDTSFENKRRVMDILDVQAVLHYDEKGKWLGVSCAIPAYNDVIELYPSREISKANNKTLCKN